MEFLFLLYLYLLSLAVSLSAWLLLLLLIVTILRAEVYLLLLIIMVTILLEGMEVVIGDNTHVVLVRLSRSSRIELECCSVGWTIPLVLSHVRESVSVSGGLVERLLTVNRLVSVINYNS